VFGDQARLGGHPVEHQVEVKRQPRGAGRVGDRGDDLGGIARRGEDRMRAVVVADVEEVAGSPGREGRRDQDHREAEPGGPRQRRRPSR
jgi:hypothetical protein